MPRRARAAALLIGLLAPHLGASLPPERQHWFEGRSAHFRLLAEAPKGELQDLAQSFEVLREILQVVTPDLRRQGPRAQPERPSHIYLFASTQQLGAYSPLASIHGFSAQHPDGDYIAISGQAKDPTQVAYHEYLHQVLRAQAPRLPLWLNEGMASFFQTMVRDGAEIRLGAPPAEAVPALRGTRPMPVAQLLAISPGAREYREDNPDRLRFYATSWLATHFLMTAGDLRRAQLASYLALARTARPTPEDFQRCFQCSPESLDTLLQAHLVEMLNRHTVATWVLRFNTLRTDPSFAYQPLPRAEALGRLGLLALPNPPLARELCLAALALDPHAGSGNLGLGLLAMAEANWEQAAPHLVEAARAEPDHAERHYWAGQSLCQPFIGQSLTEGPLPPALREGHEHLLRCLELGGNQSDVMAMLDSPVPASQDPVLLARLVQLSQAQPERLPLRLWLANHYVRNHQAALARPLFQELAAQPRDAQLAQTAAAELQTLDTQEAADRHREGIAAFNQKRYPEALQALTEAARLCPDPAQRKRYQDALEQMSQLAAHRLKGR